jgi:hypothetical protein
MKAAGCMGPESGWGRAGARLEPERGVDRATRSTPPLDNSAGEIRLQLLGLK